MLASRSSMMSGCSSKETLFKDLCFSKALSSFKIEAGLEFEADGGLVGGQRLDLRQSFAISLTSEHELDGERRPDSCFERMLAGEFKLVAFSSLLFRRAFFSSFLLRFSSFSSFVFFCFSFFVSFSFARFSFSSAALIAFR